MRTEINKIIGVRNDGEIVAVQQYFNHGDGFHGYTGATFVPVYQEEIDERNDIETLKETYDYLWQEAVKDGNTTESLDEYMEGLLQSEVEFGGKYFFGQDDSYIYRFEKQLRELFPDAVTFECSGGGRIFGRKEEYKTLLEPELLAEIMSVEAKESA